MTNPVLAELVRNNWIENRHLGAYCVVNDAGEVMASAGDFERSIYPRSAVKSLQALALFKSGAIEKFGFDDKAIAMACASHMGEQGHVAQVGSNLEKIDCTEADFECGIHPPSHKIARNNLRGSGDKPSAIHNNCSGKHSGMLAVSRALNEPVKGYIDIEHPVQKLVRASIEELIGEPLSTKRCGLDGCSIPTWATSLKAVAFGFARAATGRGLQADTAKASKAIISACVTNPFLVGGTGEFDTDAMIAFKGALMSKGGAEGVRCGSIPHLKIGFALKCDDGNMLASEVMVAKLLQEIAQPDDAQLAFLQKRQQKTLKNWRKFDVATMRPVAQS